MTRITAPPGTANALWWVEETGDPEWVWYHRNHPNTKDRWELRRRDSVGNVRYCNMVWKRDGDRCWRFWTPGGKPGAAEITRRLTLRNAKRACVKAMKQELTRRSR